MSPSLLRLVVQIQTFRPDLSALRGRDSDRGATAVEYGLILALISLFVVAGAVLLGPQLQSIFTNTSNQVGKANSGVSGAGG